MTSPTASITSCPLPAGALLVRYRHDPNYTDCFTTHLAHDILLAEFVTAFYTTWVFKLERFILKWLIKRPSTDAQARQLAEGAITEFAAWEVEDRNAQQLLLSDLKGRTRSWLMVQPLDTGHGRVTELYFGSAVIPPGASSSPAKQRLALRALLQFHRIYSVVLLYAARRRLNRH